MDKNSYVVAGAIFINALAFFLSAPSVDAAPQNIEAIGEYLIGDGPDENINTAKERARTEAMRAAAEKAGVYVESYSKTKGQALTADDIRVVSAQVLSIQKEDFLAKITSDQKHIIWICTIKATVDPDNINLEKIMQDKKAVERAAVLEKRIIELQNENNQLKKQYSDSPKIIEKETLENKIKENETNFRKAILMQPFYGSNNWRSGIDADSIQYDKDAGIISFTTSSINEVSGVKRVSGMKIYVCENKIFRTGSMGYSPGHTEGFAYKGGKSVGLEPIAPESYAEKYQKRLYQYLGITDAPVNKPPTWAFVFRDRRLGYNYYIDTNNIRCDKVNGFVYAFGKTSTLQYGDSVNTFLFDVENMIVRPFMVENGKFYPESRPSDADRAYLIWARNYYREH